VGGTELGGGDGGGKSECGRRGADGAEVGRIGKSKEGAWGRREEMESVKRCMGSSGNTTM